MAEHAILLLDPHDPRTGVLASFYAQRVGAYAAEHQPEVDPAEFTRGIMARLWLGDPALIAVAIVETTTAKLVGHALAIVEQSGSRSWVYVYQLRADGDVGNARMDALETIVAWARERGIKQVLVATNRDGKEFEKRGFKRFRTAHRLSLASGDSNPAAPAVPPSSTGS